jgi:hypothetical protein
MSWKKSLRDNNISQRELYLCSDLLVVVATVMNVASLQKIDKIIPLITATIVDNSISSGDSTSFIVASPEKTLLFVCEGRYVLV